MCLSLDERGDWLALGKPAKRIQEGEEIIFGEDFRASLIEKTPDGLRLRFNKTGREFDAALASYGTMPLPPYIASRRVADEKDIEDYQPVFARIQGAVASPTASLHFTDQLLNELRADGAHELAEIWAEQDPGPMGRRRARARSCARRTTDIGNRGRRNRPNTARSYRL